MADCEANTGSALFLGTGEVVRGSGVSGVGCGISINAPFLSSEYLGIVQTAFGPADRVSLTTSDQIRTYDVTAEGVILRSMIQANSPGKAVELETISVVFLPVIPSGNIFDEASLQKSVVPEQFKMPPKPPV